MSFAQQSERAVIDLRHAADKLAAARRYHVDDTPLTTTPRPAWAGDPPLRFGVGDRVEVNLGKLAGQRWLTARGQQVWVPGCIHRLRYRELHHPPGASMPYQVRLDDSALSPCSVGHGSLVAIPIDDSALVRSETASKRASRVHGLTPARSRVGPSTRPTLTPMAPLLQSLAGGGGGGEGRIPESSGAGGTPDWRQIERIAKPARLSVACFEALKQAVSSRATHTARMLASRGGGAYARSAALAFAGIGVGALRGGGGGGDGGGSDGGGGGDGELSSVDQSERFAASLSGEALSTIVRWFGALPLEVAAHSDAAGAEAVAVALLSELRGGVLSSAPAGLPPAGDSPPLIAPTADGGRPGSAARKQQPGSKSPGRYQSLPADLPLPPDGTPRGGDLPLPTLADGLVDGGTPDVRAGGPRPRGAPPSGNASVAAMASVAAVATLAVDRAAAHLLSAHAHCGADGASASALAPRSRGALRQHVWTHLAASVGADAATPAQRLAGTYADLAGALLRDGGGGGGRGGGWGRSGGGRSGGGGREGGQVDAAGFLRDVEATTGVGAFLRFGADPRTERAATQRLKAALVDGSRRVDGLDSERRALLGTRWDDSELVRCARLMEGDELPLLETVEIRHPNTITAEGVRALCRAMMLGGAPRLRSLYLHADAIGDTELQLLAAVITCAKPAADGATAAGKAPPNHGAAFADGAPAADGSTAAPRRACRAPLGRRLADFYAAPELRAVEVRGGRATPRGRQVIEAARRARVAAAQLERALTAERRGVVSSKPRPLTQFHGTLDCADDSADHERSRGALFRAWDGNGSGHLSLAELGGGLLCTLCDAHGDAGVALYHRYYPTFIRAFDEAKASAPSRVGHPRDGDYVSRAEFAQLLRQLRLFATWYEVFLLIDRGAGRTTQGDHRLSRAEWLGALPKVRAAGASWAPHQAFVNAEPTDFGLMDRDGGSLISLKEFFAWVAAADRVPAPTPPTTDLLRAVDADALALGDKPRPQAKATYVVRDGALVSTTAAAGATSLHGDGLAWPPAAAQLVSGAATTTSASAPTPRPHSGHCSAADTPSAAPSSVGRTSPATRSVLGPV